MFTRHGLRKAALLQLLLFPCALLAAWSHMAHEHHGFCSDHGAVIHLQGELSPAERSTMDDSSVERDHHVHGVHGCASLAFLASWASAGDNGPGDVRRLPAAAAPLSRHRAGAPAIPLLLQAPKVSPPQA
jgi:hypothetical protein